MKILLVFSTILALFSTASYAQPKAPVNCSGFYKESTLGRATASAGIFANFWGSKGSLSFESRQAFQRIEGSVLTSASAGNFCPSKCRTQPAATIYFRSAPQAVLTSYPDAQHCDKLNEETSAPPLVYKMTGADSLDAIESWIEKFSRGKGKDGSDLYARCDGTCSPRYSYLITKQTLPAVSYSLTAEVICGPARDQDNNNYDLEYGLRWSCENT